MSAHLRNAISRSYLRPSRSTIIPHESSNLIETVALSKNKDDLRTFIRRDQDFHRQCGARITGRMEIVFLSLVRQPCWSGYRAERAKELRATAGSRTHWSVRTCKCKFVGKPPLPRISRDNCPGTRIVFAQDVRDCVFTQRAKHPFHVVCRRQSAWSIAAVSKFKPNDLDGILGGDMHRQFLMQGPNVALIAAVPWSMPDRSGFPGTQWQWRRRPILSAVLVTQIDDFARRV